MATASNDPRSQPAVDVNDFEESQRLLQSPDVQESSHDVAQVEVGHDESSARPGLFVWALTATAAISGLLFGYDTGVISATLVSIHSSLDHRPLTTLDKSIITSITSFAALLASPLSGPLADSFGRKPVIFASDVLFVVGALVQAFASSVAVMTLGRAIVGLAIGAASALTPLYIAEAAPAKWRGRLVTISALFITGGQVVAYAVGWAFANTGSGWRWMVGLGALPALLQAVAMVKMPESPRWLVRAGRETMARDVLGKIFAGDELVVHNLVAKMRKEIDLETSVDGWTNDSKPSALTRSKATIKALWTQDTNRKALIIACLLQGGQQLCGFNSLMYYSATMFALVNFKNPTATALLIALTNFLFTLIAFVVIDRIGRRRILLLSIPFMSIGLFLSSVAFTQVTITPPAHSSLLIIRAYDAATWGPALLVSALLLFVASYALGLGNVPWHQSELFRLNVRALGSSLATATNWTCNAVVGLTFLPILDSLGPSVAVGFYAVICLVVWAAVWWVYPEQMGVSLEDVGRSRTNDVDDSS